MIMWFKPNHFHCIIQHVGADPCVGPQTYFYISTNPLRWAFDRENVEAVKVEPLIEEDWIQSL